MGDDLLAGALVHALRGTRFVHIEVYPSLDSTQSFLARTGGRDGRVVIAEYQHAGRGRLGRTWQSPPGSSLLFSVLARGIAPERAPLASLAGGLAVARAVGGRARLKWPNDVQLAGRKVAGVLGELSPARDFVVIGIGVNVRQRPEELPDGVDATSLELGLGRRVHRGELFVAILRELDGLLAGRETSWLDDYRSRCDTIGARVRVDSGDGVIEGRADTVGDDGALVVDGEPILAGDVIHVR